MFERIQFFLLAGAAMVAGGCVVVQQALHATLRSELSSSAFWAAFVSYTAGMLTLLFVLVVTRERWPALSRLQEVRHYLGLGEFSAPSTSLLRSCCFHASGQ